MELKKIKICEVVKMLEKGEIIRERFQRTPSHDLKFARNIIQSIISEKNIGVITLARTENNKLSILDGSSRINDIQRYINNEVALVDVETDVYFNKANEKIEKTKKVDIYYKDLKEIEQKNILDYEVNFIIENIADIEERARRFVELNTSTSLSTIQKNKGLSSNILNDINDTLLNASNLINYVFSARQIQKEEPFTIAVNIIANITNNYNSSNAKMIESTKDINDIDIDKIKVIINRLDSAIQSEDITTQVNKYNIIHIISSLYELEDNYINSIPLDNNIIVKMDTAGANSSKSNEDRIKRQLTAIKKILKTLAEPIKKEDVKEIDLTQALS